MKKGAVAILLMALGSQAIGAEQDESWLTPITDAFTDQIMRGLAQGKGGMAEPAQQHLKNREIEKKEAQRSERRTVKECIKPGNVIDDDVQECVRGYRERTW
ncbi:hypothetical protein E5198_10350 [Pseudomonas sp. A-1]|uniref:hypothetical protein n=1 Tax=Pseudomonas sp. A-1 TaxID=1821274 RepID=UPI0010A5F648|nr:hypothetical protein [Pseudomonas sp. A-1]THG82158.1 hypothetical protein E5198_10350 [Pseudomonas sp. A-1]